jgi:hypothetical protein
MIAQFVKLLRSVNKEDYRLVEVWILTDFANLQTSDLNKNIARNEQYRDKTTKKHEFFPPQLKKPHFDRLNTSSVLTNSQTLAII